MFTENPRGVRDGLSLWPNCETHWKHPAQHLGVWRQHYFACSGGRGFFPLEMRFSLYKIRRRTFPHLHQGQRSRDFLPCSDQQDPIHSLLFTFFSTSLRFIGYSVFCQLHLWSKSRIHSSTTPSLSISLPSIPCIHNHSSTETHHLHHGFPADLASRLCGPRLRQPGHLGEGGHLP